MFLIDQSVEIPLCFNLSHLPLMMACRSSCVCIFSVYNFLFCPQSSFDLLLHPAASHFHFEWQHERVLQALMCQGQQSVALRYFHVTKPPITSTAQAKLSLSVLLHNRSVTFLFNRHCFILPASTSQCPLVPGVSSRRGVYFGSTRTA